MPMPKNPMVMRHESRLDEEPTLITVGSTGAISIRSIALIAVAALLALGGVLGWGLWHGRTQRTEQSSHSVGKGAPARAGTTDAGLSGKMGTVEIKETAPSVSEPVLGSKERTMALSGVVATREGQTVSGAKVTLDNLDAAKATLDISKGNNSVEPVTPFEMSTESDANGRFGFNPPGLAFANTYRPLKVKAETDVLCGETSVYIMPSSQQSVEVVVGPCQGISGIVTDTAGAPIEDAGLSLQASRDTDVEISSQSYGPFYTGPDGTFAIKYITGGQFQFYVYADGYTGRVTDWIAAGTENLVFTLDRGNSISGRVIDSQSQEVVANGCVSGLGNAGKTICIAYTDADGEFMLSGLPAGRTEVQFRNQGKPPNPYIMPEPTIVDIVEGRPVTGLELRVFRGAIVTGSVTDRSSGAQLPGGLITVTGPGQDPAKWLIRSNFKVGPDGYYKAQGLPPGQLKFHIESKGYEANESEVTVQNYGDTQQLDLKMRAVPAVSGSVVTASGAPVAGASVAAVYSAVNNTKWPDPVNTDDQGRFTVQLSTSAAVRLQARHGAGLSPMSADVKPGSKNVLLRLADAGSIEGTVVDTAGTPVRRVRIEIEPVDERKQGVIRFLYNPQTLRIDYISNYKCETGINGFFQSGALLSGNYDITAYAHDSDSPAGSTRVLVNEGQNTHVRLQIDLGVYGAIEGLVTADEIVQSGMTVSAGSVSAVTGADGRYRMYPVTPGPVTVKLTMEGQTHEKSVEVRAEQTVMANFDLTAANSGSVEGAVTLNGAPLAQALVSLVPATADGSPSRTNTSTDEQGQFRFDSVAAGDFVCEATAIAKDVSRAEFVPRGSCNVTVQEGSAARVQIELIGASIEVTISGLRPDENPRVWLLTGDSQASDISPNTVNMLTQNTVAGTFLDPDGIARFHGIVPGPYVVATVALPTNAPNTNDNVLNSALAGRYAAALIEVESGIYPVALQLP